MTVFTQEDTSGVRLSSSCFFYSTGNLRLIESNQSILLSVLIPVLPDAWATSDVRCVLCHHQCSPRLAQFMDVSSLQYSRKMYDQYAA